MARARSLAWVGLPIGILVLIWAFPPAVEATGKLRPATEAPATATDLGKPISSNSPSVVVDPTDGRFLALANRVDEVDFDCALQVSGDQGKSWAPARPVPTLPSGADKCYAPEVAFDARGTLYYLFVGLVGAGNEPMGAFLSKSTDRGRTFSSPRRVLGPLNFGVRMVIDQSYGTSGRMYLAWLEATSDPPTGGFGPPPNPIRIAHSDDGGDSFTPPLQVSDTSRLRVVAPTLVLGSDHQVIVGYYDLGRDAIDYQGLEGPAWEGTWSLVIATSRDGGQSFSNGVVVDDHIVPSTRVMLIFTMPPASIVAAGKRMCAGWTDARNGDDDVLVRCSSNQGRQWGPARRANDDPLGNGHSQYLPRLAMAPSGRLDVIFYDRRPDVRSGGIDIRNQMTNVVFTSSDDGIHFTPNLPLTSIQSNAEDGPRYAVPSATGLFDWGSRLSLLSTASGALASWADNRNERMYQLHAQDVYVGRLIGPSQTHRPALAQVGGVFLVVIGGFGILWLILLRRRQSMSP